MPHLDRVLETALYVDDMDRARTFYEKIMQLEPLRRTDRLSAYNVNGKSVFLLFLRGGTTEGVDTGNGFIPPHDGHGQLHMAFACSHESLPEWESHFDTHNIEIEGRTQWEQGGVSVYFRDPDGNLLELAASPGLWQGF